MEIIVTRMEKYVALFVAFPPPFPLLSPFLSPTPNILKRFPFFGLFCLVTFFLQPLLLLAPTLFWFYEVLGFPFTKIITLNFFLGFSLIVFLTSSH